LGGVLRHKNSKAAEGARTRTVLTYCLPDRFAVSAIFKKTLEIQAHPTRFASEVDQVIGRRWFNMWAGSRNLDFEVNFDDSGGLGAARSLVASAADEERPAPVERSPWTVNRSSSARHVGERAEELDPPRLFGNGDYDWDWPPR
jgi:hypothetical protein